MGGQGSGDANGKSCGVKCLQRLVVDSAAYLQRRPSKGGSFREVASLISILKMSHTHRDANRLV